MHPLRPFQQQALQAFETAQGHPLHVLCIAPTGSGKSLIYEQLAQLQRYRMLLITPLMALARQQYHFLLKKKIAVGIKIGEEKSLPLFESGVWIMSPESLECSSIQALLHKWHPMLLVVDECHCIWEWGPFFRPAFKKISSLLEKHHKSLTQSLWLTATLPLEAQNMLRQTIPHLLKIGTFDLAPLLHVDIQKCAFEERLEKVFLQLHHKKPLLLFAQTRLFAERLGRLLKSYEPSTVIYHAGMSQEERKNIEGQVRQEKAQVVIATSAFGMGMDYPYLNRTILFQPPFSILSFVQMIGRVCRRHDQPSYATIFWDEMDQERFQKTIQHSLEKQHPSEYEDMQAHMEAAFQKLMRYFYQQECRLQGLRSFFEPPSFNPPCGQCDVCHLMTKEKNLHY